MYDFVYLRAESVAEACQAATENLEALFLAGGQSLLPILKSRLAAPGLVIDIRHIVSIGHIVDGSDMVSIGAGVCHADVGDSAVVQDRIPALAALAASIGDMHVRNLGTLGGSIALNDPAADYPAALLALDATVHTNSRDLAAAHFLTGMMSTALEPGEMVTGVTFGVPQAAAYRKVRNPASGFPMAGVLVARFADGHRVAVSGVGSDGAFRWTAAEALADSGVDPAGLEALEPNGVTVLSDLQASADFRLHLMRLMTYEALDALR